MFCTVVWKVAKGVLVEKIEKKTNCYVQKYICVVCVRISIKYIIKYEEENVLVIFYKNKKGREN